jgi:hypothetical protein
VYEDVVCGRNFYTSGRIFSQAAPNFSLELAENIHLALATLQLK